MSWMFKYFEYTFEPIRFSANKTVMDGVNIDFEFSTSSPCHQSSYGLRFQVIVRLFGRAITITIMPLGMIKIFR